MNTFRIQFINALQELKTEEIKLDFHTVQGVDTFFLETLGIRIISIDKR